MKSIGAIAITLVYLVSFVTAHHQPTADSDDQTMKMASGLRGHDAVGVLSTKIDAKNNNVLVTKSNIFLSTSDRVQLAKIIKEMLANSNSPEAEMSTEEILGTVNRGATTPGVLTSAAGIISAARTGDRAAMTHHAVNLLGAVMPPPPTTTAAPVFPTVGSIAGRFTTPPIVRPSS
ncbi:hypothetical protein PHMEG_0002859 [Phytophthora megakarya]|uniref:RxLR effector protein n=1 Tax=Phytophthora megakarya TaxID=4795 RepID=A0A225WXM5_9STRA|nr:hypothetical protein PHMEG_0002859 [Phytophthora megakarya]